MIASVAKLHARSLLATRLSYRFLDLYETLCNFFDRGIDNVYESQRLDNQVSHIGLVIQDPVTSKEETLHLWLCVQDFYAFRLSIRIKPYNYGEFFVDASRCCTKPEHVVAIFDKDEIPQFLLY